MRARRETGILLRKESKQPAFAHPMNHSLSLGQMILTYWEHQGVFIVVEEELTKCPKEVLQECDKCSRRRRGRPWPALRLFSIFPHCDTVHLAFYLYRLCCVLCILLPLLEWLGQRNSDHNAFRHLPILLFSHTSRKKYKCHCNTKTSLHPDAKKGYRSHLWLFSVPKQSLDLCAFPTSMNSE